MHQFVRTCSSNNQGASGIILRTNLLGLYEFADGTGAISGNMLSMQFTLTGVGIYINNVLAVTATLPSNSEFSTLFDLYMLDKIDITPMATYTNQGISPPISSNASQAPFICYAPDDDDSSATNVNTLQQYDTCKYTNLTNIGPPQKLITIYPKYASMAYQTAITTGYAPKRGFVNSTNNTVPHFGFKMAIDQGAHTTAGSTEIGVIDFIFKFYLKFKGTI